MLIQVRILKTIYIYKKIERFRLDTETPQSTFVSYQNKLKHCIFKTKIAAEKFILFQDLNWWVMS